MVFDDCCFVVRLFSMWRLVPGALLPVLFELASPVVPCEDRPGETIPLLLCSDLLTDAADGIQFKGFQVQKLQPQSQQLRTVHSSQNY